MPELELTREATHVAPDEEHLEHLLSSVPYAIGAEYIDRKWVVGVFSQLEQIFQREISGYKGSVELYLTEQNQKLHVPERIFLHLVEIRWRRSVCFYGNLCFARRGSCRASYAAEIRADRIPG